MDERILQLSKEDMSGSLQMVNGGGNCGTLDEPSNDTDYLPIIDSRYGPVFYTRDEVNKITDCISDYQDKSIVKMNSNLDAVYLVLHDSITGLTTRLKEVESELAVLKAERAEKASTSIDMTVQPSIDVDMEPERYTKDEIDEMVFGICGAQERSEEELRALVTETYKSLGESISNLTGSLAEMREGFNVLTQQHAETPVPKPSIDALQKESIDVENKTAEAELLKGNINQWEEAHLERKIGDVYHPLDNEVRWLSRKIDSMQITLDILQEGEKARSREWASIDRRISQSIDMLRTHTQPLYNRAEIDRIIDGVHAEMYTMEAGMHKRCDDIYFPFKNSISHLTAGKEELQQELNAIQRYIASRSEALPSTDKACPSSIDDASAIGNEPLQSEEGHT